MIILQAGHVNISQNCAADMRSGTGAPHEAEWTNAIVYPVHDWLATQGVDSLIVDANWNCDPRVSNPYDALIAVHYQANLPTPSGFFVGVPEPSTDGAAQESAKLAAALQAYYSKATGLTFRPEWNNVNITYYYLWKSVAGPTPCVLIECGVGAPGAPDHDALWSEAGRFRVARGIANGILAYLGKPELPFVSEPGTTPAPIPAPPAASGTPTDADRLAQDEVRITKLEVELDQVGHTLTGVK